MLNAPRTELSVPLFPSRPVTKLEKNRPNEINNLQPKRRGSAKRGSKTTRMSTSRSIRRAAERRAQKLARKQARTNESAAPNEIEATDATTESTPPASPAPTPITDARQKANQATAQLSSGPRTDEGKAKSSKNAVKTALTGRTVLLPGDDAERYAARLEEYDKVYRPMGVREIEVVQALCDTWWRLERIPGLIEALYVKGYNELRHRVTEVAPEAQSAMLRIEARLAYEREFRNLELQERRLFRHSEKLKAELAELKKERFEREAEQYVQAARLYLLAKKERRHFDAEDYGFDFSTHDVEIYLEARRATENASALLKTTHSGSSTTAKGAA